VHRHGRVELYLYPLSGPHRAFNGITSPFIYILVYNSVPHLKEKKGRCIKNNAEIKNVNTESKRRDKKLHNCSFNIYLFLYIVTAIKLKMIKCVALAVVCWC